MTSAPANSSDAYFRLRVSVVVPTRNRSALLNEALASIKAEENDKIELELIVADNGSSDDTREVAQRFGAVCVEVPTPGAAAARNAGIKAASGEFIAFLDDDDVWVQGHLQRQLDSLREKQECIAIVGQAVPVDGSLVPIHSPFPSSLSNDGDAFSAFLAEYPQIGSTIVRAGALEKVGLLDERLLGDEDWDWHLRIALAGRVAFYPEPCVFFRQRPAGANDDLEWLRLGFFRRVFMTNVRRAKGRGPGPIQSTRLFLRHSAGYYTYFCLSASAHCRSLEPAAARRAVSRAIASSPLHAIRDLVFGGPFRDAMGSTARITARSLFGMIRSIPSAD